MRAFECSCGQPLFFNNMRCLACGADVAYDPQQRALGSITSSGDGLWSFTADPQAPQAPAPQFRLCAHRAAAAACNWLVPSGEPEALCLSCSLTRTIPPLDRPRNEERLRILEGAKRRVLYGVQSLKLPLVPKSRVPATGLAFDFLEALPGEKPVLTGHLGGVITLNIAEADDDYREKNRDLLDEPYRTVIGHLRHELGHFYWDQCVAHTPWLEPFRDLFGDERADYAAALAQHYSAGPPADWQSRFMSRYAASHPWEDWAETWAHYLHIRSTLETVANYRLDVSQTPLKMTPFGPDVLYRPSSPEADAAFLGWVNEVVVLAAVINETARSMGQPDIYPFVLNGPTVTKLHFVHRVIRGDAPPPAADHRDGPADPP